MLVTGVCEDGDEDLLRNGVELVEGGLAELTYEHGVGCVLQREGAGLVLHEEDGLLS